MKTNKSKKFLSKERSSLILNNLNKSHIIFDNIDDKELLTQIKFEIIKSVKAINDKNKLENISEIMDLLVFLCEEFKIDINKVQQISEENQTKLGKFVRKLISFKLS